MASSQTEPNKRSDISDLILNLLRRHLIQNDQQAPSNFMSWTLHSDDNSVMLQS